MHLKSLVVREFIASRIDQSRSPLLELKGEGVPGGVWPWVRR